MITPVEIIAPNKLRYKGFLIEISATCSCNCEGAGTPEVQYDIVGPYNGYYNLYSRASLDDLYDCINVIDRLVILHELPVGTQLTDKFIIGEINGTTLVNANDVPNYSKEINIASFINVPLLHKKLSINDFKMYVNNENQNAPSITYRYDTFDTRIFVIHVNADKDGVIKGVHLTHYNDRSIVNMYDCDDIDAAIEQVNKL